MRTLDKNKPYFRAIFFLISFLFMVCSFQYGIFFPSGNLHEKWSNYQADSERLVIGAIINDALHLNNSSLNLFSISSEHIKPENTPSNIYQEIIEQLKNKQTVVTQSQVEATPYKSQFGLQGLFFAKVSPYLNYSLHTLHFLSSVLLAVCLIFLYYLYARTLPHLSLFPYFCVFVSTISPWTSAIARNLYWVPFTWILPSIIAILIYKARTRFTTILLFMVLSASVFIKSLCGYEFLSFIILLSIAPLVYIIFSQTESRKRVITLVVLIVLFEVIGFVIALCIHAECRSGTVLEGLKTIWEFDVRRRTFGEAELFDSIYSDSLNSSIFQVVWKYIGFGPYLFLIVLSCVMMFLTYKKTNSQLVKKIAILGILYLLPPLSWYVLAKAHSYIHTHINFVLMDFGFVPCLLFCIYICIKILWYWRTNEK